MKKMERPIQKYIIEKLKESHYLSLSDTLILLVEVRRYIEQNQLQQEYGIAKFYCDWACHSHLDTNPFAELALNEINKNLRDPLLRFQNPRKYFQTIIDSIKYTEAGSQLERIISAMIEENFVADNHFMYNLIKCIIGIPFYEKNSAKSEANRIEIDECVKENVKKVIEKSPNSILYNMFTYQESNQRITNFMFTDVHDDGTYNWEIEYSDYSKGCGFIKLG